MATNKLKNKFRKAALSTVCIFALLTNNAAAFTADDFFVAADGGDLTSLTHYVNESRMIMQQQQGSYVLNLDLRDANGNTPLMRAAAAGHVNIVDYLARNGANLSATNYAGQTAYNFALANRNLNVAEYILSATQPAPVMYDHAQFKEYPPLTEPQAPVPNNHAVVAEPSNYDYTMPILGTVLGAAALGAGIAAGVGGSGGGGGNGGGGSTPGNNSIQFGLTDTGGATGVGATHAASDDPNDFLTTESQAQEGYAGMGTQFAAARGYDGSLYMRDSGGLLLNDTADSFIKVAVMDSGVDLNHPELSSNILLADAVKCTIDDGGCVAGGDDTDGHGTFVAGIIAAEKNSGVSGMQGIAPKAKILPIAFLNEYDGPNFIGSDVSAIRYATSEKANIINASYGLTDNLGNEIPIVEATKGTGTDELTPAQIRSTMLASENGSNYLQAFKEMVDNQLVIVLSAGNDGMDQVNILAGLPYYFQGNNPGGIAGYNTANPNSYDFSKNWIAVVSLQDNLTTLSAFSNECGVAKNWCLAAPGEIGSSTLVGGGYASGSGTSYAAPNVSGALAVLMGAFPHLTPEEAVEILFDTATDLGAPGIDDIFGHGLVNLEKATDPTSGGWNIATGPSSFGHLVPLSQSTFNVTSAFGDGFASLGSHKVMFLDGHRKDYYLPLSSLVNSKVVQQDKLEVMQKFGGSNLPEMSDFGTVKVGYTALSGGYKTTNSPREETALGKLYVAADLPVLGQMVKTSFSNNISVADVEPQSGRTSLAENSLYGSFKNQYLNLSDNAQNVSIGLGGEKLAARVGYYSSEKASEFDSNNFDRINDIESKGVYSSVNYQPNTASVIGLQAGMNVENGSFLGSETGGAFSLSPETKTYFTSVSYEHSLTNNLTFVGNYSVGMTDLGAGQNSLFNNMSNAISDSFALGMEYSGIRGDDKLGFSFSQPLRVRSAKANIMLPADVATDGSIVYDSIRTSLAPEGRELDLQGYYSQYLPDGGKVLFGTIVRSEPDNVKNADTEAMFITKYSTKF